MTTEHEKLGIKQYRAPLSALVDTPSGFQPYDVLEICEDRYVVPADLEFTLTQRPKKYFRPHVILDEDQLKVIGHRAFYRAAVRAGLGSMLIDFIDTSDTDIERDCTDIRLKREFGIAPAEPITYPISPQDETFLFFENNQIPTNAKDILALEAPFVSRTLIHPARGCVQFTIQDSSAKRIRNRKTPLLHALTERVRLRSIDGLKKSGFYDNLITP